MHTTLLLVLLGAAIAASATYPNYYSVFGDDGQWHQAQHRGPAGSHQHQHNGFGGYSDSSYQRTLTYDRNRQIMEAQRRCQKDFLLLRRLLQGEDHQRRGPQSDITWFFPTFRFPNPYDQDRDFFDDSYGSDDDQEESQTNFFLDFPKPDFKWHVKPLLPEVPNVDDLPDNYDNATHNIHVVNGSQIEVNTTTTKHTDDSTITFFHTEVIHIVPDESPENTPEEEVTEEPVPFETTTEEEESTTTMAPEEDETENEFPSWDHSVKAELVVGEVNTVDYRPARDVHSDTATNAEPQRSASYVKGPRGGTRKGKGAKQPLRDLSRDTLVNHLPGDTKGGKPADPDAEIIHDELM